MHHVPGQRRSAGISILLFVVTLGVYWFVWLYKSFDEFEKRRQKPTKHQTFVPILAILYGLVFAVAIWGAVIALEQQPAGDPQQTPSIAELVDQIGDPWRPDNPLFPTTVASAVISVVSGVILLVFTRNATRMVGQTLRDLGAPQLAPNPTLAVLFNVFNILAQAPFVGALFGIPGIIIAIVWVVTMQRALNHDYSVAAQQTGGFMPADEPPAFRPDQFYAATPQNTKTARFACPECGTHLEATYTPGTPTPVKCNQCGTVGQVR